MAMKCKIILSIQKEVTNIKQLKSNTLPRKIKIKNLNHEKICLKRKNSNRSKMLNHQMKSYGLTKTAFSRQNLLPARIGQLTITNENSGLK